MSKYCPQCKQILSNGSFYKNKSRHDGLTSLCKCHVKIANKKYQQSNKGKITSYKAQTKYAQTEHGKQIIQRKALRQRKKHIDRWTIRDVLKYAIKSGVLQKDICAICGNDNTEIHHPNYEVSNNIYWLCNEHHLEQHGKIKRR